MGRSQGNKTGTKAPGHGGTKGKCPACKSNLKPHPFAELLPMMTSLEWEALLEDIRVNGQREPIVLFEGKILDGRNRWRAVMKLNRKPVFTRFKGTEADALAYCYSKAVHRNMNDSQKAAAAVNFLPHFEKAAKTRQMAGVPQQVAEGQKGESRQLAGDLFGVSGYYVSQAKLIKEGDPNLFQQIFDGTLAVTRAKRLMHRAARQRFVAKRLISPAQLNDCQFITGDCVKEMEKLARGKVRLIFDDPPYNLGFKYHDDPTRDALPAGAYLRHIRYVVEQAHDLLTPDGALCMMICEEWVDEFGLIIRKAGFHVRRLIVWHESFGQNGKNNFGRTCRFIWYAVKDKNNFLFDESAALVEAERSKTYADKRAMPGGKVADALWDISRLCGTFKERIPDPGIPTQLPVELVKRCVRIFTDPGDLVLDPHGGTGTTARAALSAGRKCILIERSKKYMAIAQRELKLMVAKEAGRD
jgi:DNA modification methylase